MMKLYIFKEVSARVPRQKIFSLFKQIMNIETEPDAGSRINLIFTTKKRIQQFNKSYRQKDKATDVLSFNIDDSGENDSVFGEVYVSCDIARAQAAEFDNTFNQEILRLCCHGFLHLLGYDHLKKNDELKMQKRETYFLSNITSNISAGVS